MIKSPRVAASAFKRDSEIWEGKERAKNGMLNLSDLFPSCDQKTIKM